MTKDHLFLQQKRATSSFAGFSTELGIAFQYFITVNFIVIYPLLKYQLLLAFPGSDGCNSAEDAVTMD
jgi:hypothetical protein